MMNEEHPLGLCEEPIENDKEPEVLDLICGHPGADEFYTRGDGEAVCEDCAKQISFDNDVHMGEWRPIELEPDPEDDEEDSNEHLNW